MKSGAKILIGLIACVVLTLGVKASADDAQDNPYAAIVQRNVFDLKPPPPPVDTNAVPDTPPPNVRLTGIATILGDKRALFEVSDAPVPGKPAGKPLPVMLKEGQRQGGLEVMSIDPITHRVKIRNDGLVTTITFDDTKTPTGPGGGDNPALAGGFNPAFNPGYNPAAKNYGANNPRPNRRSTVLPPRQPFRRPPAPAPGQ